MKTRTVRSRGSLAALALAALAGLAPAASAEPVHHRLVVTIDPATHAVEVVDRVTLPAGTRGDVELLLNAALTITQADPPVTRVALGDVAPFFGNNGTSEELGDRLELARYRLGALPESGTVELRYGGTFDFALGDQREEYARGFRETVGYLGEEGVYLAGSSFWVPRFGDELVDFEVTVAGLPAGWQVISQGDGTSRDDEGRAHWRSGGPMDEVFLVGGPLTLYRDAAGAVETLVYLHEADDALAGKYLGVTAQYLEMYRQLIGPYPYGKFALVENFWETGYGMPSFTLLGPQVIRFPFILHSSYPHEILHNWWGNSVFVDYGSGNWCEGLTAYLADHLIQEQRGQGALYRRDTLQRYRSYVQESEDFPLADFRSRHSAATEAVGYGKTLMGFHMLRQRLGDEAFTAALQRFYRDYRGERASFTDLRRTFEEVSAADLRRFFTDWVTRPGAASLRLAVDGYGPVEGGYLTAGYLAQMQPTGPFLLDVPVVVATTAGVESTVVRLDGERADFEVRTTERPLAIYADPAFDVFRLLDPRETPPSIGQLFGEPQVLAVLPSVAGDEEVRRYRELLAAWQSDSHHLDVRTDAEVTKLPADQTVWVLGRDNRLAADFFTAEQVPGLEVGGTALRTGGEEIPLADHSWVVVRRHPKNPAKAVGWLAVSPPAAFPGMARKLPHYGKYSYLGFAGDEPTNVVKGQWSTSDSPLAVDLRPRAERSAPLPPLALPARSALAELPPVFSQGALMAHVTYLAAPEREGRGIGSAGLRQAADYVAERFAAAGLKPGGDDGGYLQELTVEGPGDATERVANVVGYLPGSRAEWDGQSVVVSAHYDHLGRGWPDVHAGDEGQLHPGADDNASGVAVLLELAKSFAEGERPPRTLVFVAFTAEEADRLGSRYYVEHPTFPLAETRGVVNLDTVGRLGDQPLSILGTGTAEEWQHIFRGVSYVTGVPSRNVPGAAEGSDQQSFIERGVPGVQIFTQAHADYHRPSDTVDKVDAAGLVKVATVVKEAVAYLGEREEPLTVTIDGVAAAAGSQPADGGGRRVRFGAVPEFAFPGPGVELAGVSPGSPAEHAGFQAGDVLLRFGDVELTDLAVFSAALKTLEPGQTVAVTFRRGAEERTVEVKVEER